MEARASVTVMQQELVHIEREMARLIQAIKDGVPGRDVREPMIALGDRKEELKRLLQQAPEPKPLLHVGMADIYRQKVVGLREALEQEDARPKAAEAVRGLLDVIILKPEGEPANRLGILVQGNLAAMLTLAHDAKRPSDADDLARSVMMVAGACNQLEWQVCRVA
jgi:site-specific DNA recombinase